MGDGVTALIGATIGGHVSVVKLLVEHGADANSARGGLTALVHAAFYGQEAAVKVLLRAKPLCMSPARVDTSGWLGAFLRAG
jgi:ankyrin repeat protein